MKAWRILYRTLAFVVLADALWGIGCMLLAIDEPMGGFIWYYDEAVSGGWIVNWDTGVEWPAIREDRLQLGDRILTIDGRPPEAFGEVYRTTPIGMGIPYRVLRDGREITVADVPVVPFTWSMFLQSQAVLCFIGSVYWAMGMFIHYATPAREYSYAFSFFTLATSLITLSHASTVCVTRPIRPQGMMFFFWKPIFGAAVVSCLHFATAFPLHRPELPPPLSKRLILRLAWGVGIGLWGLYVITGVLPAPWRHWDALAYQLNLFGFFLSLLACAAIFTHIARTSESFIARQQAIVMLVGWGLAAIPILLMWIKLIFPRFYLPSWNVVAFLELALPLSIVYAILHYRLFDVQPYILRLLFYSLLGVGFLFTYVIVSLFLQSIAWVDGLQTAFTHLTYQRFDLRATVSALLAALVAFRLYIPLKQWTKFQSGLKLRFPAILAHLCDRLDVQNAYIALRQGEVFVIEATHAMPLPRQSLTLTTALGAEPQIALKVPLDAESEPLPLGVIALGPKRDGQAYPPAECAFVREQVAGLLTASLLNLQRLMQLEDAAQVSRAQIAHVQETAQDLQRELTHALTIEPEAMIEVVEQALYALSYDWPADLEALAASPLADLSMALPPLGELSSPMPRPRSDTSEHLKGHALKRVLVDAIEALKPPGSKNLDDDAWLHYLILKGAFVEHRHWKQLHGELLLSQASYYRKRRVAIARVTAHIEGLIRV